MEQEKENLDYDIRKMAQDAELDADTESMVPPTWRRSTSMIVLILFCLAAISLIAILFAILG